MPVKRTAARAKVTSCESMERQYGRCKGRKEEKKTHDPVDPRERLKSVEGVGVSSVPVSAEDGRESGSAGKPVERREERRKASVRHRQISSSEAAFHSTPFPSSTDEKRDAPEDPSDEQPHSVTRDRESERSGRLEEPDDVED
jgi:hypothetical protein